MVNILWTAGHRLPAALSNCPLLSVSAEVLKFSPFYSFKSVCWAHAVHGEHTPTFPWEARPSKMRSSQSGFGKPLALTKAPLTPVAPQQVLLEAISITEELHGQAGLWQWPGIIQSSRAWDCLVTDQNKSWSRGTQWRLWWTLGAFPSSASGDPVKPCIEGYGIYPSHPLACWSSGHRHHLQPEQRTLPHAQSTWLQLRFPLKLNSCHSRTLCMCHCLNFVSLLGD